jgi:hypothetical protein
MAPARCRKDEQMAYRVGTTPRKRMEKVLYSKILTISDVIELGRALIQTANLFPMRFVTERDFFPLVITYLNGRVPAMKAEALTDDRGRIDFRLTGNNPTWLELAVQARAFKDKNYPDVQLPGYSVTALLASQNKGEIRKLMKEAKGKTRFLLLLDLNGSYNLRNLESGYRKEAAKHLGGKTIRVIYVSATTEYHFRATA